jgi:phage terminase small subunit
MPRKSPDAKSAMYFRTGAKAPAPPAHLPTECKATWKAVTASRPPDFFTVGSLPLLESYCHTLMMHRYYTKLWTNDAVNRDRFTEAIVKLNASLAQLATKLRLAQTSIDRRAGILSEVEPSIDGNVIRADLLFGGTGQGK